MNTLHKTALAIVMAAVSTAASAHAVWLERDGKSVQLFYGEYDEARREASPGRLDTIGTPHLFVDGSDVEGKKAAKGWRFAVPTKAGVVRAEAQDMAVQDWRNYGIGVVKPLYFARYADSPSAQKPVTALDVVPVGKVGEFQVSLDTQPLVGIKVVVVAPNGWTREVKSDANGRFAVSMPWRGLYVLEATHLVSGAGEFNGVAYEGRRMRATLSYRQSKGPATFAPAAPE